MEQHGLPVPRYQLMNSWTDTVNPLLRYPLISKLNSIHGSVEIDDTAVAENERQLRDRVKHLTQFTKMMFSRRIYCREGIIGSDI